MINQENPFPQMSNEEPWLPKPSVALEELLNLDEKQLEAVVGSGGCIGCQRLPENVIRTPNGNPARTVVEAYEVWEHEHTTPAQRRNATWMPNSIEPKKGQTVWVKDTFLVVPRPSRGADASSSIGSSTEKNA
jgi:hypothetical protein